MHLCVPGWSTLFLAASAVHDRRGSSSSSLKVVRFEGLFVFAWVSSYRQPSLVEAVAILPHTRVADCKEFRKIWKSDARERRDWEERKRRLDCYLFAWRSTACEELAIDLIDRCAGPRVGSSTECRRLALRSGSTRTLRTAPPALERASSPRRLSRSFRWVSCLPGQALLLPSATLVLVPSATLVLVPSAGVAVSCSGCAEGSCSRQRRLLSYCILSCLVLSYLVLSYLVLPYLIVSYLVLSCLARDGCCGCALWPCDGCSLSVHSALRSICICWTQPRSCLILGSCVSPR